MAMDAIALAIGKKPQAQAQRFAAPDDKIDRFVADECEHRASA